MNTAGTAQTAAQDTREVVISRLFEAPREQVWAAWTEPDRLARWWGPKCFTCEVRKWEAWPDGAIDLVMIAPDGARYPMTGTFHEAVAPEWLVFTAVAVDEDGHRHIEALTTVTLDAVGKATQVTVEVHGTALTEAGIGMIAGMQEGWSQSLDCLDGYLGGTQEET